MNALSKIACIVALALPVCAAACAQTANAQGGSEPSLSLIDPANHDDPIQIVVDQDSQAAWEKELRAARAKQIARLKEYAAAGRFAMASGEPGLSFVWRDREGRLCAMAHLVNASGRSDLVNSVAVHDNDMQLASLTEGELYEWMLRSGLTQEEIQLVQEPAFAIDDPANADRQQAWEVARKREHLRSVVERLEMSTERSIQLALARLGNRASQPPVDTKSDGVPTGVHPGSMPGWGE